MRSPTPSTPHNMRLSGLLPRLWTPRPLRVSPHASPHFSTAYGEYTERCSASASVATSPRRTPRPRGPYELRHRPTPHHRPRAARRRRRDDLARPSADSAAALGSSLDLGQLPHGALKQHPTHATLHHAHAHTPRVHALPRPGAQTHSERRDRATSKPTRSSTAWAPGGGCRTICAALARLSRNTPGLLRDRFGACHHE